MRQRYSVATPWRLEQGVCQCGSENLPPFAESETHGCRQRDRQAAPLLLCLAAQARTPPAGRARGGQEAPPQWGAVGLLDRSASFPHKWGHTRRLHSGAELVMGWAVTSLRPTGSVIDPTEHSITMSSWSSSAEGCLKLLLRFNEEMVGGRLSSPSNRTPSEDAGAVRASRICSRFLAEKRGKRGANVAVPCGTKLSGSQALVAKLVCLRTNFCRCGAGCSI